MAVTVVNSQSASIVATGSVNVSTAGLSLGDICFVFITRNTVNMGATAPAGWTALIEDAQSSTESWAKAMITPGDITGTNTFTFPTSRGVMFALGIRGANVNLNLYQGGIAQGDDEPDVDWSTMPGVPAGSISIAWQDAINSESFMTPGNITVNNPSGYTDSGFGAISYGLGSTLPSTRLSYKLNVSGSVAVPSTAPSGGSGFVAYTSGHFLFPPYPEGTAALAGAGDLTVSSAESSAEAVAAMSGEGSITVTSTDPLVCDGLGYAGGWYGGTLAYGGYGICEGTDIEPLIEPVKSNVLDIDDSPGRLGCGEPTYFITSRCGGQITCVLDGNVSRARWTRRLDDISDAEITVDLGGDTAHTCCACLAETEPWCHELHIWRDGEEVWVGPIMELEYSYNQVIIRAKDSLAWLTKRISTIGFLYEVLTDVVIMGQTLLEIAFTPDDGIHSCEIDNMYAELSGVQSTYWCEAFTKNCFEILLDLAVQGLDFTTLGRSIVLVGNDLPLTPLVLLNDEHIQGDIIVTKDGVAQANHWYVHFDDDENIPVENDIVDTYCYGKLEAMLDTPVQDGASAVIIANLWAQASGIAPRMVEVPDGSRLSPDTPWTINQMVPGARVDVAVTRLCLELTQSFRLTEVQVEYGPEGESVGISLAPLNTTE